MAITYNNLYLDIRRRLKQAGYPGAGLEARELVCAGSGKTREEFYRDAQLYVTPETEETVLRLVDRHLHGEPVAYLIGEWEFYGLPLDINESVLIPRVDTEVLAHEAIEYIQGLGKCRVLDLCAAAGASAWPWLPTPRSAGCCWGRSPRGLCGSAARTSAATTLPARSPSC